MFDLTDVDGARSVKVRGTASRGAEMEQRVLSFEFKLFIFKNSSTLFITLYLLTHSLTHSLTHLHQHTSTSAHQHITSNNTFFFLEEYR
jgi:hypothetical protein